MAAKNIMSQITNDPTSDPIVSLPHRAARADSHLRKVGGVILPSKTWVPFVAGAVGGMSGPILTAPLDVVKTRLQSDFYRDRLQATKYSGTAVVRFSVWRHLVETTVIIQYVLKFFFAS